MEIALHLAPRLLLLMMLPIGLIFFVAFFALATKDRRRLGRSQKLARAVRGFFQQLHHAPRSRYAYAMEQQQREHLFSVHVQPIYFRGRKLTPRGQ